MSEDKYIKVSVCVVTYNQRDYIEECLDSLLSQEVDFNFEIIVGDDASTDGTAEKIQEYADRYPGVVYPRLKKSNVGAGLNIADVYKSARGKYIAHLDGDDYALPGKLQKQVNALESNPSCVICSHDMVRLEGSIQKRKSSFGGNRNVIVSLSRLYKSPSFFAHSSKMFVRELPGFGYDFLNKDTIDFEIHLAQALYGDVIHLDEFLGVYRVGIGMSFKSGRLNPLLPAAARRVFSKAIEDGVDGLTKSDLQLCYAKKMLSYSFNSARRFNATDSRDYIKESIGIRLYSPLQILIYVATFFPKLMGFLANLR